MGRIAISSSAVRVPVTLAEVILRGEVGQVHLPRSAGLASVEYLVTNCGRCGCIGTLERASLIAEKCMSRLVGGKPAAQHFVGTNETNRSAFRFGS